MPYCTSCGSLIGEEDQYCSACGAAQEVFTDAASPSRSQPQARSDAEPEFADLCRSAPQPAVELAELPVDNVATGIVLDSVKSHTSGMQVHCQPMAKQFAAGNHARQPSAMFLETTEVDDDGTSSSEARSCVCGWLLTLILWGLIIAFGIGFATDHEFTWMLMIAAAFVYLVYLSTSFMDPCARYLKSAVRSNPYEYVEMFVCNPPKMSMHIECYHVTRSTDSDGSESTSEWVTHRAEEPIPIRFWDDVSQIVFPRMGPSLVRLDLELVAEAADDATLAAIDGRYSEFVERNKSDTNQRHSVRVSVDGFPDQSCALLITDGAKMGCFGFCSYVIFTFLTLSAPYRMFFYSRTSRVKVQIKKVVRI